MVLHGTAFLHCRTQSGNESPQIQWFRGGHAIGNSAKVYLHSNGTLRILNTNHNDDGVYVCRVKTSGGQAEAQMHLSVLEAPKVRVHPDEERLFVAEGKTFSLSCAVSSGKPLPKPIWYFGGMAKAFSKESNLKM